MFDNGLMMFDAAQALAPHGERFGPWPSLPSMAACHQRKAGSKETSKGGGLMILAARFRLIWCKVADLQGNVLTKIS